MSDRIVIESLLLLNDKFKPMRDVAQYAGDCDYVHGAISMLVDGVELMGETFWDDIDWLWPFVIQRWMNAANLG